MLAPSKSSVLTELKERGGLVFSHFATALSYETPPAPHSSSHRPNAPPLPTNSPGP